MVPGFDSFSSLGFDEEFSECIIQYLRIRTKEIMMKQALINEKRLDFSLKVAWALPIKSQRKWPSVVPISSKPGQHSMVFIYSCPLNPQPKTRLNSTGPFKLPKQIQNGK